MNSPSRADGLDGLRGLAAAAIVLLHVWMFSGAHQSWQPVMTDRVIGTFGLALMMFFVLSGLLVARPWVKAARTGSPAPDLPRYAIKRAARIVPAYLLCILGSFVLMQAIDHPLAIDASELPAFLLFAQNQMASTAGQLNPPLWSLGIEVSFYFAVPLIGGALIVALRRAGAGGALAIALGLVATGLLWSIFTYAAGAPPTLVNFLPTYLPIFACGIAAAVLTYRQRIGRAGRAALLAGGALLVFLDGWWHSTPTGWAGHVVRDLPAGAGFALIAAAVMQSRARILGSAPLRRLGEYSYGIYLWHMPVLYLLRDQGHWPQSPWMAFATVFGLATALGAASWLLVERHVVAWAGRLVRGGAPAPARPVTPREARHPARPVTPREARHPAHLPRTHAAEPARARRAALSRR